MSKTKGLTIGFVASFLENQLEGNPIYEEYSDSEILQAITKSLEENGNKVILINASREEKSAAVLEDLTRYSSEIDLVLNTSEGVPWSRSRKFTIPTVLEHLNIPYIGSPASVHTLVNNKNTTRSVLKETAVRQPFSQSILKYERDAVISKDLVYPVMVKPACDGSSVGIEHKNVVYNEEDLNHRVEALKETFDTLIIERFLPGKEHAVGLIGDFILPLYEINLENISADLLVRSPDVKNKYADCFSILSQKDSHYMDLVNQTITAFKVLGLQDYARMDFRCDEEGNVSFLEANSMPGLHPSKSHLPFMAKSAGISYKEMINLLVYTAVSRYVARGQYCERFSQKRIENITGLLENTMNNLGISALIKKHYKLVKTKINQ